MPNEQRAELIAITRTAGPGATLMQINSFATIAFNTQKLGI